MTTLEITFLGTGAGMSTTRAHTAIAIRCSDGTMLLLDGSSGNSALRNGQIAGFQALDYDHVLLSHDHQDHLSGLMFIQAAAPTRRRGRRRPCRSMAAPLVSRACGRPPSLAEFLTFEMVLRTTTLADR